MFRYLFHFLNRRLIVGILVIGFSQTSSLVAQDRGFPMSNRPLSQEELALSRIPSEVVDKGQVSWLCDMQLMNVTCEQYLKSLQEVVPDAGLSSIFEVSDYIRKLVVVRCRGNQSEVRTIQSRIMKPSGEILFDWNRLFYPDELCLFDPELNRLVLSLECANTIILPELPAGFENKLKPEVGIEFTDSVLRLNVLDQKGERYVDNVRGTLGLQFDGVDVNLLKVKPLASKVRPDIVSVMDTIWVKAESPLAVEWMETSIGLVRRAWIDRDSTVVTPQTIVLVEMDDGGLPAWVPWATGVAIGIGIGCIIWCGDDNPPIDEGGPVNPPNSMIAPRITRVNIGEFLGKISGLLGSGG